MVMIELRDEAYNVAFDLLEEAKHSAKKTKLTLCELEDAMYDCLEASDDKEDYEDSEMDFRSRRDYRHEEHYGVHDDEDDTRLRSGMRMGRRRAGMRRSRLGRFV